MISNIRTIPSISDRSIETRERDTESLSLFNINVAYQNFELDAEAKKALSDLKTKTVQSSAPQLQMGPRV